LAALQADLLDAENASQSLRHQLEQMKTQYEDARHKLALLNVRQQACEARSDRNRVCQVAGTINTKAFERFHRMKDKVERAEAEAVAILELARIDSPVAARSEPTLEDLAVEEELNALKASLHP
jgi:phage shock protein A